MDRAVLRTAPEHDLVELPTLPSSPLVSVLIANYNYAEYIGEALESLVAQTYQRWEAIVCDDGSSDNSREIIKTLAASEPRIVLLSKDNGGQASALNRALRESRGEIICVLDADDSFMPTKLQQVVRAFGDSPIAGMVIHNLQVIDGEGRHRRVARYVGRGYLGSEVPTLRLGLPIPQASGLSFRREVLGAICPIPEEAFRSVADWAIGYAAAFLTITECVPEALARYRIHDRNLSGTTATGAKLEEDQIRKTLAGMERVLRFVSDTLERRAQPGVDAGLVRNVLEHRLMLGILRKDRAMLRRSVSDLRTAYRQVRRDYPAARYLLWRVLASLPSLLAKPALDLSFQAFRMTRTLRGYVYPRA